MACCFTLDSDLDDGVQLTPREWQVCALIAQRGGDLGFGELKRELGLHQEVLSRVLRRLRIHGLVEQADGRYRSKSPCCAPDLTRLPGRADGC